MRWRNLPSSFVVLLLAGCGKSAGPGARPAEGLVAAAGAVHADGGPDQGNATLPIRATDAGATDAPAPSAEVALWGAPIGHLYGTNLLTHVFESLAGLDDGDAHEDVRILQYGDSHTASDLGVGVVRRTLQTRFGEGGRGFVSIGRPWKGYGQDGIRGGMTREFEPTKVKFHKDRTFTGIDGCYGLLGVGIETDKAGARAWTEVAASTSRIELDYGQGPLGGSFDVTIDGAHAGRVATRAAQAGSGWLSFDVADTPHRVELRTLGDGQVRIFGMTLDRSEAGVVVDALGINGAQIFTPLRWNEAHFADQLRHAAPALMVVAYGTNEALEPGLGDAEYERKLVDFLGRIARATPAASCILLGPPDLARRPPGQDAWRSVQRLGEIVAVQRKVAEAAGCAFYDQQEAMGGPGSIVTWALESEPRAQRDRVHLTRTGYAQVAASFADDLVRAYGEWRVQQGLGAATESTSRAAADSGSPPVPSR